VSPSSSLPTMIGIHSAEIARKPGFLTMPFCEGERRMSGRSYRRPQTFLHLGFPSKWETFRIRNPRCTYTSATDLAAVPPEKERPQNVAVDERLQGFPAPLDREIVRMAIPSLATVIMDPLLGAVDTGASLFLIAQQPLSFSSYLVSNTPCMPI
jgi:hypothetical protein